MSIILRWLVRITESVLPYLITNLVIEMSIYYQCALFLIFAFITCCLEYLGINHRLCSWVENKWGKLYKQKPRRGFISFKDAISQFGEKTACYNSFKNIWERELGITQEEYYKNCLLSENEDGNLPIYGCEKFSSVKELQEIPTTDILSYTIQSPNYDVVYSSLNEELYTKLSVKLDDLTAVIQSGKYKNIGNRRCYSANV